jgi:4-carboxymuconolactone decarboxylase
MALAAARAAGWPRRAAEEVALMLVLHAGYPAALEAMATLARVWPGRARHSRAGSVAGWRRRGERLCRRVYSASYPRLVANVTALHPELAKMMIEQGYGRVLSRPGLSPAMRELVAVTVLAATGWERQLVSHLLGAVRLGAGRAATRDAMQQGTARGTRAAAARAWRVAFPARGMAPVQAAAGTAAVRKRRVTGV